VSDSRKTILVVEDDDDIREGLREILEAEGYRVVIAHNGQEALECAELHRPALILLDLMMPVMDGFAFIEVLRRTQGEPSASIPVVLVTAAGDTATAHLSGMPMLPKPIDIERLLQVVAERC
jgi:CheY-like chemotaxis protein